MNKRLGALLLSALLSGCQATTPYTPPKPETPQTAPEYLFDTQFTPSGLLRVNTDRHLKKYRIDQSELEQKLTTLAHESPIEEAWVYNTQTRVLQEIGFHQSGLNCAIHNFMNDYSNGADLIFYHIHPTFAQAVVMCEFDKSLVEPTELDALLKRMNETHFKSVPSYADLAVMISYTHMLHQRGVSLQSKIVDRNGITTVTISEDVAERMSQLPTIHLEIPRAASVRYHQGLLTFDQFAQEYAQRGIVMNYEQLHQRKVERPYLERAQAATLVSK